MEFRCIKDAFHDYSGAKLFTKGKSYFPAYLTSGDEYYEHSVIDDRGDRNWLSGPGSEFFEEHFELVRKEKKIKMKIKSTGKSIDYSMIASEVIETNCEEANEYFVKLMASEKGLIDWLKDKPEKVLRWFEKRGYIEIIPDDPWENLELVKEKNGTRFLKLNGVFLFRFKSDETIEAMLKARRAGVGNYNQNGQIIVKY